MKINCLRNDGLIKYKSLLGLFRADYVKKPRCSFGYTYVFCLVGTKNTGANLVHFINPSFLSTAPHINVYGFISVTHGNSSY